MSGPVDTTLARYFREHPGASPGRDQAFTDGLTALLEGRSDEVVLLCYLSLIITTARRLGISRLELQTELMRVWQMRDEREASS
jgi:hypothetical protein